MFCEAFPSELRLALIFLLLCHWLLYQLAVFQFLVFSSVSLYSLRGILVLLLRHATCFLLVCAEGRIQELSAQPAKVHRRSNPEIMDRPSAFPQSHRQRLQLVCQSTHRRMLLEKIYTSCLLTQIGHTKLDQSNAWRKPITLSTTRRIWSTTQVRSMK